MTLEIQTSDAIHQPKTAWFLYGAMGSGKTRAAASFPAPLFLIPANEGSELTLKQLTDKKVPFVRMGKRADGTVVKVRQHIDEIMGDLEKRHAQMWAGLAEADKLRAAGDDAAADAKERQAAALFPWETIVVESLTHLGDLLVDDVGDMGKKKMDQQGWGVISTFLRTLHSRLRNLDAHIVYTSLAKVQMDDDGGVVAGGPNLIGSMAEKLPSACDTVVYMEELPAQGKDGKPTYRAFFRRYKKWHARTRFGGLPDFVDNFNFGALSEQFA